MPKVKLEEKGCRGCTLCVDTCPVEVFQQNASDAIPRVVAEENCIGCLSCYYVCPSQCIAVEEYTQLLPLHRVEENVAVVERFLQEKTATTTMSEAQCAAASKDVSLRLNALAQSIADCMGRGQNVVGRKAGTLAAAHLPEMYEGKDVEQVLKQMQRRFKDSFDFDYRLNPEGVDLTFHPCGMKAVVESLGQKVGEAPLCGLFHEYWAGLLGAFSSKKCQCKVPSAGDKCEMKVSLTG
ncbi:MAG: ferredoxin family protein [Deltaproteobacteria bacterium]|nr:ferredoxin family protein [Deltaproteobacteria bacterium]